MRGKILLVFISIFVLISCQQEKAHELEDDSLYYQLNKLGKDEFNSNYHLLLKRIEKKQIAYREQSISEKNIQKYLLTVLTDSVFQYWYDTEWDFNGITQEPRKGNIACGYFVTTTLKQVGLNIDRVKIAQQASSKIIRTLCDRNSIKSFYNKNFKGLKKHLLASDDGLYIVGLDNHVGFIHKTDTTLMFIHSGVNTGVVCREEINHCKPVKYSKVHVVGNLLKNSVLLQAWVKKEKINLVN